MENHSQAVWRKVCTVPKAPKAVLTFEEEKKVKVYPFAKTLLYAPNFNFCVYRIALHLILHIAFVQLKKCKVFACKEFLVFGLRL